MGGFYLPMKYFISQQLNTWESVIPSSMEALNLWLQDLEKPEVGVDIETTGLNFLDDKMLLFAIGNGVDQFVVNTLDTSLEPIRWFLESPNTKKILHNAAFDYKFLRKIGITLWNIHDTMLAEQVLTQGKFIKSYGLKAVTLYYTGKDRDKEIRKNFINQHPGDFNEGEVVYAAEDVEDMVFIMGQQLKRAEKMEVINTMHLENSSTLAFADIEFNGIKLNKDKWITLYNEAMVDLAKYQDQLDEIVLCTDELSEFRGSYQLDLFINEEDLRKVDINWRSPKQVLSILQKFFPTLTSTGEEDISAFIHPLIDTLLSYKKYSKRTGTYGKEFFKFIGSDGKIHTSFSRIKNTGRVSSAEPNMQQIPADNRYRNCFGPSNSEYVIVSADYKSQELALIAFESRDPVWLTALEKGQDLHSTCAELVYGEQWKEAAESDCAYYEQHEQQQGDVLVVEVAHNKCSCKGHKVMRNNVKTVNFGLAYGMSAPTLSERLRIPLKEAEDLINSYFKAFPAIRDYLEFNGNYAKKHGLIRTMPPFNRIRFFGGWAGKNTDYSKLSEFERQGKNTRIQGSGADMTKYALVQIRNYIKKHDLPVRLIMQVHDQIDTEVRRDYALKWKSELETIMNEAAKVIVTNGLLTVDAEISEVWKK